MVQFICLRDKRMKTIMKNGIYIDKSLKGVVKPLKSGGNYSRDSDGNILKVTAHKAHINHKKWAKNAGFLGLKNYFVNDCGEYWTVSAC